MPTSEGTQARSSGMADSAQHGRDTGHTLPTHRHQAPGDVVSPHWRSKTTCLAWLWCPWPGCTVWWPLCGAVLHPELSSLGYAGVFLLWTPMTWPWHHLSYPSSCSFPYSTFTWTCLAGALSTRDTFLSAACYWSVPVSSVTPLPPLPWEEKTVQQLVLWNCRERGVTWQAASGTDKRRPTGQATICRVSLLDRVLVF